MPNFRRTLAVQITTPGGDNPLLLNLVTPRGVPPFYRGVAFSGVALQGRGGTPPYAYTILSGSLPTGTSLNGTTGAITGTPTTQGHYTFIAKVQDSASNVFNHVFSIDILGQLIGVRVTPVDGENILAYSYQMVVRDLSGTTITSGYSLLSGNLPSGLTISAAGLISGTPDFSSIGFSYATIRVNNGSDILDIPIVIHIYPPLLGFSIDFELTLYAAVPITQGLLATTFPTGGRPPYSYSWDNLSDYSWLSFNYNTYQFSGTPPYSDIGIPQVIIGTVTDTLGATLAVEFRFTPVYAIAVINNVINPTRQGGITFSSSDGSVTIEPDTSGGLDFRSTGGSGTVTSVAMTVPTTEFTITGSPITSSGTFALAKNTITANLVAAGPATGSPAAWAFRALVTADLPTTAVTPGSYTYSSITVDATGRITSASSGTAPQVGIQFKDEGSNLGTSGTATSVDFVGAGVSATRVSDAVTVTINSATASVPMLYGDGSDGTVLLDGTNTFSFMSKAGSVYTLNRDIYADTLSSNGTGTLVLNGFRVWCYQTLDLSSFPAAGITRNGGAGAVSVNETTGGGAGSGLSANTLGASATGSAGGGGGLNAGSAGGNLGTITNANGGLGAVGGTGGAGSSAGGAGGTVGSITPFVYRRPTPDIFAISSGSTQSPITGGQGGSGGGGGGGNGSANGAAGGGGGGAGGPVYIAARNIVRPTNAGTLQAIGGAGGNGATRTAGGGPQGGGAGGGGGGGGWIHLVYNSTSGAGTGTVVATGGAGGNGGAGRTGGAAGGGGPGGSGGLILLFNIGAGTTTTIAGSTGSAASGTTGGAGGACSTTL